MLAFYDSLKGEHPIEKVASVEAELFFTYDEDERHNAEIATRYVRGREKTLPAFRKRLSEALDRAASDLIDAVQVYDFSRMKYLKYVLSNNPDSNAYKMCWALLKSSRLVDNFFSSMMSARLYILDRSVTELPEFHSTITGKNQPTPSMAIVSNPATSIGSAMTLIMNRMREYGYPEEDMLNSFGLAFSEIINDVHMMHDGWGEALTKIKVAEEREGRLPKELEAAKGEIGKLKTAQVEKDADYKRSLDAINGENAELRGRVETLNRELESVWTVADEMEKENTGLKENPLVIRVKGDSESEETPQQVRITLDDRYKEIEETLSGTEWDPEYVTAILGKGTKGGRFAGGNRLSMEAFMGNVERALDGKGNARKRDRYVKAFLGDGALEERGGTIGLTTKPKNVTDTAIKNYVSQMMEMRAGRLI